MISTSLSTLVGAPRRRVWCALSRPSEILRWDDRAVGLLEPVPAGAEPGGAVRWRYRVGAVVVPLLERTLEVVPEQRLRSSLELELLRLEQIFTLGDDPADPMRTRLVLRLAGTNSVSVVGGQLDRFEVRRFAAEFVDARLRWLQKWCENEA